MKTFTISVADDVFQRASQKAAAERTSLPEIVQDLLSEWTQDGVTSTSSMAETRQVAEFVKFLDDLAARPLKPGLSVGPLNREKLYQRGVSGH